MALGRQYLKQWYFYYDPPRIYSETNLIMGEEHVLRGELIYTFNYLGSTPLLDDAFRFSTRALATTAHQPWCGSREMANGVASKSAIQGCSIVVLIPVHLVAAQRDAGGFFFSLFPKTSEMLNPCPVNLQPAVTSRSLSTKKGNKAVSQGGG